MSKPCLVMLTDCYPFERGETYIEQEIDFLAEAFSQVFIIPMRVHRGVPQTRPLPPNVRALLTEEPRGDWRWWTVKWAPRILGSPIFGGPRIVRNCPLQSFTRFAVDMRFAATVYESYDAVRPVIRQIDFSGFTSVTLYSYWFYQGVGVGDLLRRRELAGLPVTLVARAHRYDVDEAATPRKYLAARPYLLEAVDRVYPISDFAAQFLRAHCPPNGDKIEVRRLGVAAVDAEPRRREDPLWVASCSFMDERKRVELIAQAVGLLQERGVLVRWTHFGESSPQRLAQMQQLIDSVCPDPQACELRGFVPNPQVRAFYGDHNVQVFVNCSASEGVPVSVMEALASSIPCVATDVGGTREIVRDHANGLLLAADLPAATLADALQEVAELSAAQYAAYARQAHQTWEQLICADTQYSEFARELALLAESQGTSQGTQSAGA